MTRRIVPAPLAFAGFRFPLDVILLAVRWYLRYGLSYRDLQELLAARGVEVWPCDAVPVGAASHADPGRSRSPVPSRGG